MNIKGLIFSILAIALLSSCVSVRKLEDEKSRRIKSEAKQEELSVENKKLTEDNNELLQSNKDLTRTNEQLLRDTSVLGKSYNRMVAQYDKVNALNDELISKMKEKNALTDAEAKKLLAELQVLQEDLQQREDALKMAELELSKERNRLEGLSQSVSEKQALLDAKQAELDAKQMELDEKNARVLELESMIAAKDSALTAFKDKLSKALLGFEGEGLKIDQRDGKVYVSLDEKLLFKSGKWVVDPKGQKALNKLSSVLVENPDINVMIEGHTDNVPYRGSTGIKDNWDLSVKRSTSIVKILLKNKGLNAQRVIAAGRGEFLPLDMSNSKEGRAKNRRTEIILTPNWDEVFKALEKN